MGQATPDESAGATPNWPSHHPREGAAPADAANDKDTDVQAPVLPDYAEPQTSDEHE